MSAVMIAILKLLFLCALAHTVSCLAFPATTVPKTYETTTDPPHNIPEYLIVRGEDGSQENSDYKLAASILLKSFQDPVADQTLEECNNPSHKAVFSPYDYTVLLAMLVISLGIGIFYGFFKKSGSSSNEFLLGSEMSIFPVTLSLTTSFITAIELLGNPSEMYFQGTQFVLIVIPMVFVIPVAVKIFYPIYFKMELTSCYEYLGIRFGKEIRVLGAVLYVIQMCFYTAVAVLAPAIALSKATGLNTKIAVILIYVVCVFYSSQGGMKAVVIADTFQAVVLAISLVLVVGLGCFYSGSPVEIFNTAADRERLEFFNFNFDPTTRHTVWSVVIGGFFYWTSLFCTNQASVQKCMSLKSLRLAKIALGFAILGLVVVFLLNFYTGLMVFNHYADCDPLTAGRITATDQLLPFYIINTYEHIYSIAGIFVAGIFAASLGTVASALNSLSAVTCEDLLVNGMNIKISADKGALYAKWMSLGFGIFSFGLVFIVERLGGVLQATLTLNGLIGGVTLGLFSLGIAFKRANTKGAFYGGIISLIIVIFIGVVAQIANVEPVSLPVSVENCDCAVNATQTLGSVFMETIVEEEVTGFTSWPIFRLSYMWYSMIGCLLTMFLGLIISVIINIVQRRRVFKITSVQNANNINLNTDTNMKVNDIIAPTIAAISVDIKPSEDCGHVNHAIRLDDE
ncbi:putative sodium-dependent multivitamin transporter [Lucilia cuprina]|uniref:putative sodium-dependent multivitamin transporter n=1 Tax=Lucilia cuprina TaxID=7375 RepID=UPI001F069B42|nr:putative sodium-dependent multivitamin transporter [Lucilia cuprina]